MAVSGCVGLVLMMIVMTNSYGKAALAMAAGLCLVLSGTAHAQVRGKPTYNTISEDLSEQRRAVFVRISRRLDEAALLSIAGEIQSRAARPYARTNVNFLLPNHPLNQSAWASVTFTPEPKVVVHGLSQADEDQFLAEHRNDSRPLLGSWLTSPPAAPGRLTIYSDHGKVFAEWRLRGGQKTIDELIDTLTDKGRRRFDVAGGGYYVLSKSGELEIWDKTTLIAVAERIRPEHLERPVAVALGPKSGGLKIAAPVSAHSAPTAPALKDQMPSSPVQPEPKVAASVSAIAPSAAHSMPTIAAPSQAVEAADVVPGTPTATEVVQAPVIAKPRPVKTAKSKAHTKIAATASNGSPGSNTGRKARAETTGDMIAAKLAGRY